MRTEVEGKVKHFRLARQGFAFSHGHETLCLQGFRHVLDAANNAMIIAVNDIEARA